MKGFFWTDSVKTFLFLDVGNNITKTGRLASLDSMVLFFILFNFTKLVSHFNLQQDNFIAPSTLCYTMLCTIWAFYTYIY